MTTELDHDDIKGAIEGILEANTSLFDVNDKTKLMDIFVGKPMGRDGIPRILPGAYITNNPSFETIKKGRVVQSDAWLALEHTFNYDFVMMVDASDAKVAENQLDDFQKLALQSLEADHKLKNGGSARVDNSYPSNITAFRQDREGMPLQGRKITLTCQKLTS